MSDFSKIRALNQGIIRARNEKNIKALSLLMDFRKHLRCFVARQKINPAYVHNSDIDHAFSSYIESLSGKFKEIFISETKTSLHSLLSEGE